MHCELVPVEDNHGKIKKLIKFFQEKNWVRNRLPACKESHVRQPGASGFCDRASEFCG